MKPYQIKIKIDILSTLDFIVHCLKSNGFVFEKVETKKKWIWFGRQYHELSVYFNPSEEIINNWINQFIKMEDYENAAVWRDILKIKIRNGYK